MSIDRLPPDDELRPGPVGKETFDLSAYGLPCLKVFGRISSYMTDFVSEMHTHRGVVECLFCGKGHLKFVTPGGEYDLMPGQAFVSRPNEPHAQVMSVYGARVYGAMFSLSPKDWVKSGFTAEEANWVVRRLRALPRLGKPDKAMGTGCNSIHALVKRPPADRVEFTVRIRALVLGIVAALLGMGEAHERSQDVACIEELVREMRAHPERPFAQSELDARARMATTKVVRLFKLATGFPPHAFLLRCRIERIKELLRDCENLESLAQEYGFASRQHLARQFKLVCGLSPREWLSR